MQNEDERDVVLTMADVVADYEHRKAGVDNDLARFAEIGSLEPGKITAPTLVIVGSADTDVPRATAMTPPRQSRGPRRS
jgi:pimeloyl-ACP methyl ester carboxylesterase